MFLAWFKANQNYTDGHNLTYFEFPSHFVFNREAMVWQHRKRGISIGRLHYVPPGTGELYYMRILLTIQRGCTSYESMRTINGVTYPTFQEACYSLGLLSDDREYIDAIREASELGSGYQLRKLFVVLLMSNSISNPEHIWDNTWGILSEGILYQRRQTSRNPNLTMTDLEIKNLTLIEIEKLLHSAGRSLHEFNDMPYPDFNDIQFNENRLIQEELEYDMDELLEIHSRHMSTMTVEQKNVYDEVMSAVLQHRGGLFFVYGYGGTGKTFIWNALSGGVRMKRKIVLNVASSGIASLLLPGGRTSHSRFSIPLQTTESSTCNIIQGTPKAELMIKSSLIIWDEAPMLHRYCFEALDRTLRDLMKRINPISEHLPFGGKVVVLGGDFRQILPVIPKGTRQDVLSATINSSVLWDHCKVLKLHTNMRLQTNSNYKDIMEMKTFVDWIIDIGDGKIGNPIEDESEVEIPDDLLIHGDDNPLQNLVNFAYPNLLSKISDYTFFESRSILAPTLESVEKVNDYMLSLIPRDEKVYLSSDTVCQSNENDDVQSEWFTTEFLNDIRCSGIPNHKLILKIGVPVLLMRNIDQSGGLCNGTRLIVSELGRNVIGATVVTGRNIGDKVYIRRMNLIPSDSGTAFKFQRRQFPLMTCFAMTINKSQGQSLSHVGLYLPKSVFTHGQLYVAVSRVKTRQGLKILALDEHGNICTSTTNVVFKEVFENV